MNVHHLSTWRALSVSILLAAAGPGLAEEAAPTSPPKPQPRSVSADQATPPAAAVEVPAKSLYAKGGGFSVRKLSAKELKKLKRTHGLYIDHIVKGTPAEAAGLKVGDVLTSLDGKSTKEVEDAVGPVTSGEEGQTFRFVVVRGGRDLQVDLRLPGESREEREAREKKEREEREVKEREERERREAIEREEREAREKAEAEAKEKAEQEAKEKLEAEAKEDKDRFGLCGCCIASMACPAGTPFFALAALLVENESPPPPPNSESEVTVVAY